MIKSSTAGTKSGDLATLHTNLDEINRAKQQCDVIININTENGYLTVL